MQLINIIQKSKLYLLALFISIFFINPAISQHHFFFDTYNTNDNLQEEYFDNEILETGITYKIVVEGNYSVWGPSSWTNPCGQIEDSPIYPSPIGNQTGNVGFDMEYIYSLHNTSSCNDNELPQMTSKIEISLDNGKNWFHPESGNGYVPEHIYEYEFIGKGYPIGIRQIGPHNSDDYGMLKFSISLSRPMNNTAPNYIDEIDISVYPNPTSKNLTIESISKINKINIYDIKGIRYPFNNIRNSSKIHLDVSHLNSGIYFIEIKTKKGTVIKKVQIFRFIYT